MKKILLIVTTFLMVYSSAQDKEFIRLKGDIPNYGEGDYNTLQVIDNRKDKTIGILPFGENREMKEVSFQNGIGEDLGSWYRKSNLKGGKQDLILVLNDLKLSVEETGEKKNIGMMDFSVQSFVKDGEKYHFLYKKDTVFRFIHKDVSDIMVKNMYHIFSLYFEKTFKAKPLKYDLSLSEISDYQNYVKHYPAFTSENLQDGIYLDYHSFFRQVPEEGTYVIERFEDGTLDRAVKTENDKKEKIPSHKIFMYVENGKAYKNTFRGFQEIHKNENGFYLQTKPETLFPPQYNLKLGMMFGLVGGIANALMEKPMPVNKNLEQEVYIDPMTGEYDLQYL